MCVEKYDSLSNLFTLQLLFFNFVDLLCYHFNLFQLWIIYTIKGKRNETAIFIFYILVL